MNGRALARVALPTIVVVEVVLAWPVLAGTVGGLHIARPGWVAVAVLAELASMHCFARTQRRMVRAAGIRLPLGRMVGLTYAANAVNTTLPGGTALSAGYVVTRLRRWGVTAPAAAFAVLASGAASLVTFAVLGIGGAALAGGGVLSALGSTLALVAAVLVLCSKTARAWLGRAAESALVRANRILHRSPYAGVQSMRRTVAELSAIRPRRSDWAVGFSFAALNWLADLGCLLASSAAVGVPHADLPLLVLAYLAGMGASGVSVLPGGLGVIDAAMIVTLVGGGADHAAATACALLYRAISLLLVVAIGWVAWSVLAVRSRTPSDDARGATDQLMTPAVRSAAVVSAS